MFVLPLVTQLFKVGLQCSICVEFDGFLVIETNSTCFIICFKVAFNWSLFELSEPIKITQFLLS